MMLDINNQNIQVLIKERQLFGEIFYLIYVKFGINMFQLANPIDPQTDEDYLSNDYLDIYDGYRILYNFRLWFGRQPDRLEEVDLHWSDQPQVQYRACEHQATRYIIYTSLPHNVSFETFKNKVGESLMNYFRAEEVLENEIPDESLSVHEHVPILQRWRQDQQEDRIIVDYNYDDLSESDTE
jgi:hypothetical protein